MAFDADGAIQAAHIDFVSDCGAYPTPWPVVPAAAVGMLFPGPYRVPRARASRPSPCTPTPSGAPRTAGRGSSRRSHARCCSTSRRARCAWIPSTCAGAICCARRPPVRECQRHAVRPHHAARDVRAGAGDARLRRRSAASRPTARPAGRYLGVGVSAYVEPSTPATASTGAKRRRSASNLPAGSTSTSPAVPRATASRPPSSSSRPTRSA